MIFVTITHHCAAARLTRAATRAATRQPSTTKPASTSCSSTRCPPGIKNPTYQPGCFARAVVPTLSFQLCVPGAQLFGELDSDTKNSDPEVLEQRQALVRPATPRNSTQRHASRFCPTLFDRRSFVAVLCCCAELHSARLPNKAPTRVSFFCLSSSPNRDPIPNVLKSVRLPWPFRSHDVYLLQLQSSMLLMNEGDGEPVPQTGGGGGGPV